MAVTTEEQRVESHVNGVPVVLIVEENNALRVALVQLLAEAGYRATTARDEEGALIRLRHGLRPCLILLDVPERSFRAEQKKDPRLADIPTVALTASDARAQLCDATATLPIPFDPNRLLEIVDTHCSSAGRARFRH